MWPSSFFQEWPLDYLFLCIFSLLIAEKNKQAQINGKSTYFWTEVPGDLSTKGVRK